MDLLLVDLPYQTVLKFFREGKNYISQKLGST